VLGGSYFQNPKTNTLEKLLPTKGHPVEQKLNLCVVFSRSKVHISTHKSVILIYIYRIYYIRHAGFLSIRKTVSVNRGNNIDLLLISILFQSNKCITLIFYDFLPLHMFRHTLCHPQGGRRQFTIFNTPNCFSLTFTTQLL
jgi:hypothetical protein